MRLNYKYLETKLRVLLIGFCIYTAIHTQTLDLFPNVDSIVNNYIFIIISGIFSFCAGLVLNEEIEILKKDYDWSWTARTKSEYMKIEYIGLLYFVVQMGLMAMFFPEFEQVRVGSNEIQLFPFVFAFNSIIIYIIYRLRIIKIKKV